MKRWIASLLLFAAAALADSIRPAYLEIVESSPGVVDVIWKLPKSPDLPSGLMPELPASYTASSPTELIDAPDSVTRKWSMVGKPLAGGTILISELNAGTMEALVRVELSDGSTLRTVLSPAAPGMTLPTASAATTEARSTIWTYAILFGAAIGLTFLPTFRTRGIIVCSVALVAGSLMGDAIGTALPKHNKNLSTENAGSIIEGLMLNTYRAFIFDHDEEVYEILSKSVAGTALNDIYLENRDRLTFDDEESAASLVDRLDVKSIESMMRNKDGSITMFTDWDVYGTVFHWEHEHFRCNAFTAEITIVPTDGYWKITRLEVLDEERVL